MQDRKNGDREISHMHRQRLRRYSCLGSGDVFETIWYVEVTSSRLKSNETIQDLESLLFDDILSGRILYHITK